MGLTEMNIRMNGWEAKAASAPRARLEDLGLSDGARTQLPHIGTVMIVDDDREWASECAFMLDMLGYPSVSASSAEEALVHMHDEHISLIIVDYSMPDCDGLALVQELSARAEEDDRNLRFIMVTGHATVDVAVGAMRASIADFLQKPVSRDDLRRSILRVSGLNDTPTSRSTLLNKISSLSSELQRLAQQIDEPGRGAGEETPVDADYIRAQLRAELKRRQLIGGDIFGDPAWHMLLDLLLAKFEGRTVSVSSACIASGMPTTTALRLINRMVKIEVLCRIPDDKDGRRDFLLINPDIEQALLDHLQGQSR